jgi:hypothetical protein
VRIPKRISERERRRRLGMGYTPRVTVQVGGMSHLANCSRLSDQLVNLGALEVTPEVVANALASEGFALIQWVDE